MLYCAHSHNDYLRRRPLWDALEAGFGSVEVDVHRVGDRLVVSHAARGLGRKPDIEALYLAPLNAHVLRNGGRVYADDPRVFTLMVDVKSEAEPALNLLLGLLQRYPDLWKADSPGAQPAVRVVISGNRPDTSVLRAVPVPLALDGRMEQLQGNGQPEHYPWISASWGSQFNTRRPARLQEAQRKQIARWADAAEAMGAELRFWAAGNRKAQWTMLQEAGVQRINVDRISRFVRLMESSSLTDPASAESLPRDRD